MRAAEIYAHRVNAYLNRAGHALQMLATGADIAGCAKRFYMAGALHQAGRTPEARAWLASLDQDILHAQGNAGWKQAARADLVSCHG